MHGLNWTLRHAMESVACVLLKREDELAELVRKLAKDAEAGIPASAPTPPYHDPVTADGCIELGQYLHGSNGEATQDGPATAKTSRRSRARSG